MEKAQIEETAALDLDAARRTTARGGISERITFLAAKFPEAYCPASCPPQSLASGIALAEALQQETKVKRNSIMFALCLTGTLGLTRLALSQETTTRKTTEVTDDGVTKTTTKTTTVDGTVVRYERGKTIVVRGADDREVTYTLAPNVTGARDLQVGRHVSLTTDPGDGATLVTRITTQSVTPEGNLKTEVQTDTAKAGGETTSSKTTTVTGKVTLIDPGHTVTITLPNKETVEYVMDSSSVVPKDMAVGKTVTVYTTRSTSDGPITVKKITTKTTTKTTKR